MGRFAFHAVVLATVVLTWGSSSHGSITVVTPGNPDGWALYQTDENGIINAGSGTGAAEFVGTTPAGSPLPPGSVHLATGAGQGDESSQLRNSSWAGTTLASLTSLSYSTYATAWNGQQLPYLTIWLDLDGDLTTREERLWFEPDYTSPAALNTWQTWDVLTGQVYGDSFAGPGSNTVSFSAFKTQYPTATIINDPAQSIGGIRITTGFASAGDDFNTYVDNFTIGTAAGTTTYDFELEERAVVPEPYAIAVWSVLGLCGSAVAWRSRRRAGG